MTNGSNMEFGIRITADGKVAVAEAGKVKESLGDIGNRAEQVNRKVEQSAKQAAFAMRQLPMQMTDIVTGLASGQSPFMVLMQQGGQLKDVFGGIGPAARAVGGYVAGLVNPFGVAAAAAGALAAAYYAGSKEADAYRNALILTGNAAGTTAGQMQDMAGRVASATRATQGAAAEAVAGLAATGKVSADALQGAAAAAVAMQRATGAAIDDTVKQFAELGKSPVAASLKLNEQTNYLTASVYRQIKALEDRGRIDEAAALAQKAYSDAMIERSGKIEQNLGTLETSWRAVADAAKFAWDTMLGVGRQQSVAERIAELEQLAAPGRGIFAGRSEAEDAELARLKAKQAAETAAAKAKADSNAQEEAGIRLSQTAEKYLGKAAQMKREIAKVETDYAASAKTSADIEARRIALAGIRDKYSATRPGGAIEDYSVVQAKQYATLYEASLKYAEGVDQQAAAATKLTQGEKLLATAKEHLTAAQYKEVESILAGANARERELRIAEEARKQEQARLDAQWKAVEGNDEEIKRLKEHNAEIGLSAEQLDALRLARMDDVIAIKERQAAVAAATSDDASYIDTLQTQVNQLKEMRGLMGKGQALERSNREAVDMWQSIERAGHDAWNSIGKDGGSVLDSLKRSLKTGIYDLLYQMTVKKWIINIATAISGEGVAGQAIGSSGGLAGFFDKLLRGSSDSGFPTGQDYSSWSSSFDWASIGVPNAKGGIYSSPDLHQYANTVVTSPTLFKFAKGGALGVMGEAGEEGILPLRRDSAGRLGVSALMGGGIQSIRVEIDNRSANPVRVTQAQPQMDGRELVLRIVQEDIATDGPVARQLSTTFGLGRAAGAY